MTLTVLWKIGLTFSHKLNLSYGNTPFTFVVSERLDLAVLEEIFINQEYYFAYSHNPKVIVDLGANIGDSAIYYSIMYPNARIFALEPHPGVFKRLTENTRNHNQITPKQVAISDRDGEIELHVGGSHLGSSAKERGMHKKRIMVPSMSLSSFCKSEGINTIDILKFDIEGSEEELLGDSSWFSAVRFIAGEIHEDLLSIPSKDIFKKIPLEIIETKYISKKRYILYGRIL